MSYHPCELHCHTVHSDGGFQVKELLWAAKEDNLALIALTDHNTFSGYGELDDTLLPAVRGIEWTTYFGHMLVLGADKFIDWRDAVPDNIDEKIKQVKEAGGIAGIAHPFQLGSPLCTGGRWEFKIKDWSLVDYIEVWHQDMTADNHENERALALWTSLLDRGFRIAASYGRDWHRPEKNGYYGCTYLDMDGEATPEKAVRAVKMGRTVISTGAKFFFRVHRRGRTYFIGDTIAKGSVTFSFFTDLHARSKNAQAQEIEYKEIRIVTNGSKIVLRTRCDQRHVRLRLESGKWYRAELWGILNGKKTALAITSPVYCV